MSRDNKLIKWNKIPKFEEREDVFFVGNLMTPKASLEQLERSNELIDKVRKSGRSAKFNRKFCDNIAQETFIYGVSLKELVSKSEFFRQRCHGTVWALSLVLDDFKWVFADLKMQALGEFWDAVEQGSHDFVAWSYGYARDNGEIEPAYNHSYLELPGRELLAKDMIHPESVKKGFKVDDKKTYVFDCLFDVIMEKELYDKIMQPNYFKTFTDKQIKETELWKITDSQKKLDVDSGYSFANYLALHNAATSRQDTSAGRFLSQVVFVDKKLLTSRKYPKTGKPIMPHLTDFAERIKIEKEAEKNAKTPIF